MSRALMSCSGSAGHLVVYTMLCKHTAVNHLRCGCGVTLIYITMEGSASITHRGHTLFHFSFSLLVLMPAFCKRDMDADVLYCGAPAVPPQRLLTNQQQQKPQKTEGSVVLTMSKVKKTNCFLHMEAKRDQK